MKTIINENKRISLEEQKKIMLDILKYIDEVCRNNNINYTLVGGSLIGAIRHHGIIPWDDDIDIGLLPKDYDKLVECLKKSSNNRYLLLDVNSEPTYWYPFSKVVDTKTICIEKNAKRINNYGIYVDIFKYNIIPNDMNDVKNYYDTLQRKMNYIFKSVTVYSPNFFKNIFYNISSRFISLDYSRKLTRDYISYSEQYNNHSDFHNVMINCSPYGYKNETHKITNFNDYIDVDFDGIKAMIIKDYDEVLTRTFGDYMTPPPVEKQKTHHVMDVFWK